MWHVYVVYMLLFCTNYYLIMSDVCAGFGPGVYDELIYCTMRYSMLVKTFTGANRMFSSTFHFRTISHEI